LLKYDFSHFKVVQPQYSGEVGKFSIIIIIIIIIKMYQSHFFAGSFQRGYWHLMTDVDSWNSVHRHNDVIHSIKPQQHASLTACTIAIPYAYNSPFLQQTIYEL